MFPQFEQQSAAYKLRKIGAGTCGTVFSQTGTGVVFKLAKHKTDALTGDLFNDFKMHGAVLEATTSTRGGGCTDLPRIPRVHAFYSGSDRPWWDDNTDFSATLRNHDFEAPCDTLCSERIDPVPPAIRSGLTEKYCPERLREHALRDTSNDDCLVRVYPGARRPAGENPRKMFFSLRNYKLHLDQMQELDMDMRPFARAMAGALATMHWKARIDAKDVEFALGLSPRPSTPTPTTSDLSPTQIEHATRDGSTGPTPSTILARHDRDRKVDLWLLDFNLCSSISMDDDGVAMAAKAWKINDPYYPRPLQPNRIDQELWNVFVCRYIEVSDEILQTTLGLAVLPRKFIASIIEIQRERQEAIAS